MPQGPNGRPVLLGAGRWLYSSASRNTPGHSKTPLIVTATLAGCAAKAVYTMLTGSKSYKASPTWSTGGAAQSRNVLTTPDAGTADKASTSSVESAGFLGNRNGGDIIAEQVTAATLGLAAAVGLGGCAALLGPSGQKLGLDTYGHLMVAPVKRRQQLRGRQSCRSQPDSACRPHTVLKVHL